MIYYWLHSPLLRIATSRTLLFAVILWRHITIIKLLLCSQRNCASATNAVIHRLGLYYSIYILLLQYTIISWWTWIWRHNIHLLHLNIIYSYKLLFTLSLYSHPGIKLPSALTIISDIDFTIGVGWWIGALPVSRFSAIAFLFVLDYYCALIVIDASFIRTPLYFVRRYIYFSFHHYIYLLAHSYILLPRTQCLLIYISLTLPLWFQLLRKCALLISL